MYQAYPHAPQSSFHPAQPAPLPYHPAPPVPSAARTSPAIAVLVAMALMALLGATTVVCGVLVAALALAPDDVANPVAPTAHILRDKQM